RGACAQGESGRAGVVSPPGQDLGGGQQGVGVVEQCLVLPGVALVGVGGVPPVAFHGDPRRLPVEDASTTPVGDGRHDLGDVVQDLALALGGGRVPRHAREFFVEGVGVVVVVFQGEAVGGLHHHDVTFVTGGDVVQVGAQVVEGAVPIRVIGQPDHVEVDTVFGRGVEPPAEHGVVATFGQVHHDLG